MPGTSILTVISFKSEEGTAIVGGVPLTARLTGANGIHPVISINRDGGVTESPIASTVLLSTTTNTASHCFSLSMNT